MRTTLATINAALKARGIPERLTQYPSYVAFVGGDSALWFSANTNVCRGSHLVRETLEATIMAVLKIRTELQGK